MTQVSWPAAALLSVLLLCTTALVWKGFLPNQAFFAMAGVIVGWVIPKAGGQITSALRRQPRDSTFPQEEIPTKKNPRPDAITAVMPAYEKPKPEDKDRR